MRFVFTPLSLSVQASLLEHRFSNQKIGQCQRIEQLQEDMNQWIDEYNGDCPHTEPVVNTPFLSKQGEQRKLGRLGEKNPFH